MGWDCPRCAAENPLSATRCLSCGYQYFPGYESASSSTPAPGGLRDSLAKQRETIREDIRKGLDEAIERSKAALDDLADAPKRGRH